MTVKLVTRGPVIRPPAGLAPSRIPQLILGIGGFSGVAEPTPPAAGTGAGGGVYRDWRAGGINDIQAAGVTTLAQAKTAGGCSVDTNVAGFTLDVDGSGSIHAYRFEWPAAPTQQITQMVEVGPGSTPNEPPSGQSCYWTFKRWYGRTATGGGVGNIGDYNDVGALAGGHKQFVCYRVPGGAPTNRIVMELGTYGDALDVEGGSGNYPNSPPYPPDFGFPDTGFISAINLEPIYVPANEHNKIQRLTFQMKPESAPMAKDGILRAWYNGVLCAQLLDCYTSIYSQLSIQLGGPTFRGPQIQMTDYAWDYCKWIGATI